MIGDFYLLVSIFLGDIDDDDDDNDDDNYNDYDGDNDDVVVSLAKFREY